MLSNNKLYNRFDASDNVKSVDIIQGRRIQSAELNEMQSIAFHRDKVISDAIFGSGNVLESGGLIVNKDSKEVTIAKSRIYHEGIIHDLPESTLPITLNGEDRIGILVEYKTVTYEEDKNLLDPAVGYSNYGLPGADRTVYSSRWVINNDKALTIYTLINGELLNETVPPEFEGYTPILARRTNDTNGSFLVSGMDAYVEEKDADNINLVIDAGKAYVLGYEITKPIPTRISIPKSKEFMRVTNETKTYLTSKDTYKLNSSSVKTVNSLTAIVEVTKTITRGNSVGTLDSLPNTPVVSVTSVKQGDTTYVSGDDYQLSGNAIDWSLSGQEPIGGTSYSVVYRYTKVMVEGVDYKLLNDNIVFLTGDKPVDGTTFQVTYDFYLSRMDSFYLTHNGEFKVVLGQSSTSPFPPSVPPNVLELGRMSLPPDNPMVEVTNLKPKRLTMLEMRSLLDRLERSEYNQAITDLDNSAKLADPSMAKKGILTDNFSTLDRIDINHELFDATISPEEKELFLPISQEYNDLVIDKEKSTVRFHERLITADYVEETYLSQRLATEPSNVNPYAVFGQTGTISLIPSTDSWVEQSTVTKTVWNWWSSTFQNDRTETKLILDQEIMYMRQRVVEVVGKGFTPMSDNIKATFDGVLVPLTPTNSTISGTIQGTIRANAIGEFTCKFTIPNNIRTGTREVKFYNEA